MSEPIHTIVLDRDGIWFRVRVEPAVPGFNFDLDKEDGHYVRSYARSLSRQRGWPLVDQTGEAGA